MKEENNNKKNLMKQKVNRLKLNGLDRVEKAHIAVPKYEANYT